MINILNSLIGFVFIYRTMNLFLIEKKFPENFLKKFFNFLIFLNCGISFFVFWIPTWLFSIYLILQISLLFYLENLFNLILKQQFDRELLCFIDEAILTMTTGRSFREALLYFYNHENSFFSKKIFEIYQSSVHDNNIKNWRNEPKFLALWQLFKSLEQNSHKVIEKLRAFRRQLYWEQTFRQKSARATVQVKAQALILSILYVGLLFYILSTTQEHIASWIFLSLALFCSGLLSLYILGRRKKWKT